MQFNITCPIDGSIDVSLEDIDTVVLREPEQAEVVFRCPECGSEVSLFVRIPSFLLAAIEAMAEDGGGQMAPLAGIIGLSAESFESEEPVAEFELSDLGDKVEDAERIDSYCEYFRQQLAGIDCVDDVLTEIGRDDD